MLAGDPRSVLDTVSVAGTLRVPMRSPHRICSYDRQAGYPEQWRYDGGGLVQLVNYNGSLPQPRPRAAWPWRRHYPSIVAGIVLLRLNHNLFARLTMSMHVCTIGFLVRFCLALNCSLSHPTAWGGPVLQHQHR